MKTIKTKKGDETNFRRWWDIHFFLVGLVIQSIFSLTKHIQQHHDLKLASPNLQQVGCVWFSLTRGPNLNLLYFDQFY
jgi:hypothetical protein